MTATTPGPVRLDSTTLAAVAYDDRRGELQLDFRDGARYAYSGVAPDLFRDLLCATSKAPTLIDTFEVASLMPNYRPKTKWHWA